MSSKRADYGIDAPKIIRFYFLCGIILLCVGFSLPFAKFIHFKRLIIEIILIVFGFISVLIAALRYNYSINGKLSHRDRLINFIPWKGDERVLDIGTGRGLMMIGAAKKIIGGIATGIDVWNDDDLSGNDIENARVNVLRESVSHKTVIKHDDARKLSFPDASFDIVFSNNSLHCIEDKSGRKKACKEIIRVLKPGGIAIISDFKFMDEYTSSFQKDGHQVNSKGKYWLQTFPPMSIIEVRKV